MPQQETFLDKQTGSGRIRVVKTYDRQYAREVFDQMDEASQARLWKALKLDDDAAVPAIGTEEGMSLLWEELVEAAREDWNLVSFFIVSRSLEGAEQNLFVSPDWPSAEAVAESVPETAV